MSDKLANLVADLIHLSSYETIEHILSVLHETKKVDLGNVSTYALALIRQPNIRSAMDQVFIEWYTYSSGPKQVSELITIIATAYEVKRKLDEGSQINLVWTGPQSTYSNIRRIDEALIEILSSAKYEIIVVSFAVYKATHIMKAINDALDRGVQVSLYLETSYNSGGKITFDTIEALDQRIRQRSKIYIWPFHRRVKTENGAYGALHAKLACIDGRNILISSANITGYAMELNMELGILIRDKNMGRRVSEHLERLVEQNIFELSQIG